ncbi:MAG TPA: sulfatase-like hydrolase/transferase [Gemmataceae bacterium]|nr:sulfatase-like hydrolase/transferase [Gemmataceae bacterium]
MKVLFLVARGLHLGYLGCYGNDWIETPALDRLAAEGVVFDQHIADQPDAAGARRAWRTGRYHLPLPDEDMSPPAEPAADLLRLLGDRGIPTALVLSGDGSGWGDPPTGWKHFRPVPPASKESCLKVMVDAVLDAIDRLAPHPDWLLCADLNVLLPPWDVPAEFGDRYFRAEEAAEEDEDEADAETKEEEPLTPLTDPVTGPLDDPDDTVFLRLQRSYAGAVTFLDAGLELLLTKLRESGLLEEALLLVTSDHGMALGEHGIVGPYRPWLHDELIHLPLIVRLPGGTEAGRRVFALTQPVDLMPTLLEVFGLPVPVIHGRSLLPLLHGSREPIRAYACSGLRIGEAVEWALRTPEWGFLLPVRPAPHDPPRPPQLYVKPDDRWEVNNVLQHHLELGEHLEQVLRGFAEAVRRSGPLEPPALRDVEAEPAAPSGTV